jgi:hypothetical protein
MGSRNLDYEKDSLHIMPLVMVPLKTAALRHARMIKNVHFDSMIEVFNDGKAGSGQIDPSKLGRLFNWPPGEKHPDGVLVAKLSLLQSFDVYSLRIQLRSLGVEVENSEHLRLSLSKRQDLDKYMRVFTRPLMKLMSANVEEVGTIDPDDVTGMLKDRRGEKELGNLKRLSKKLKIILSKLPDFLTDYGDVFLSLAYFKDQFAAVTPQVNRFLLKIEEMRHNDATSRDPQIMETLEFVETGLIEIMEHISGRIGNFDRHTESMWDDLNVDSFRKVKVLIESNHAMIGGMLCGLYIKMQNFEDKFGAYSPSDRAVVDYIAAYIKPGIARIKFIERSARFAEQRRKI